MEPPPPFVRIQGPPGVAWVRPEARKWVEETFASGRTLHGAAGAEPRFPGEGLRASEAPAGGRGPIHLVQAGAHTWVVRHSFRGGAVAPLLTDRYLRLGRPRPFREAAVSEELRTRSIPTPRVVAAAVYPHGIFYRGDVTTELVPRARNLARILFGDERSHDGDHRRVLLQEAGRFTRRLAEAGVRHRDLNVTNLLVGEDGSRLVLLDLDRCTVAARPLPDGGSAMAERLARSLRKWEGQRGPPLAAQEWAAYRGEGW